MRTQSNFQQSTKLTSLLVAMHASDRQDPRLVQEWRTHRRPTMGCTLYAPRSWQHKAWTAVALLCRLYSCWVVPFRLAFLCTIGAGLPLPATLSAATIEGWLLLDYLLDLLLLLDMYLQAFHLSFYTMGVASTQPAEVPAYISHTHAYRNL